MPVVVEAPELESTEPGCLGNRNEDTTAAVDLVANRQNLVRFPHRHRQKRQAR